MDSARRRWHLRPVPPRLALALALVLALAASARGEGAPWQAGDRLEPFTLYVLARGEAMTLRASSPARIMLLGGEAFSTQRHVFWNFVSSSRDRINQAKEDWKAARFDIVPGDEKEFIPLPER